MFTTSTTALEVQHTEWCIKDIIFLCSNEDNPQFTDPVHIIATVNSQQLLIIILFLCKVITLHKIEMISLFLSILSLFFIGIIRFMPLVVSHSSVLPLIPKSHWYCPSHFAPIMLLPFDRLTISLKTS